MSGEMPGKSLCYQSKTIVLDSDFALLNESFHFMHYRVLDEACWYG